MVQATYKERKRLHKEKKKTFLKQQLEEQEKINSGNSSGKFYQKLNSSQKKFKLKVNMIKNTDGNIISEKNRDIKSLERFLSRPV